MCIPRNTTHVTTLFLHTVYQIFPGTAVGNDLQAHLTIKKYDQINGSGQDSSKDRHEKWLMMLSSVNSV